MTNKLYATEHQLDVLRAFSAKHGRNWKSVLKQMWYEGSDCLQLNGGVLRQIRNDFGPRWLTTLRLQPK